MQVGNNELEGSEESDHEEGRRPAFGEREGGRDRQHRGNVGADIRQISQHGRQEAPEDGELDAEGEQAGAQHEPERTIDERLHEQETADPLARLVDEPGGRHDAPMAHEPDHPVAEFLPLLEHEDHEDDCQGKLAEVLHHGGQEVGDPAEPDRALGLEDHGLRPFGELQGLFTGGARGGLGVSLRGWLRARDLAIDFLEHAGDAAGAAKVLLERLDLGLDRRRVLGQLAQQARDLRGDNPAGGAEQEARGEDCDDHRGRAAQTPEPQSGDDGVQEERQKDRQRDRNKN